MINEKILKANGYNRLQVEVKDITIDLFRHADAAYQKLVRDGDKKKYFINAYYYESDLYPAYEFEVYSHLPNGAATQTLFYGIHDMSIEDVEKMIDEFFTNSKMLYYENDPEA